MKNYIFIACRAHPLEPGSWPEAVGGWVGVGDRGGGWVWVRGVWVGVGVGHSFSEGGRYRLPGTC